MKTALITGASKGIGRAVAHELAAKGLQLILVSRGRQDLERLRDEIAHLYANESGVSAAIYCADLSDDAQLNTLLEQLVADGVTPDVIVHNAGGSLQVTDPFAPLSSWQKVWSFNVGAGVAINNTFIPSMRARKWGRIVHVSSASAGTFKGHSSYVSAKCALVGYVKSISRVVAADGVIVSAVAPGAMRQPDRHLPKVEAGGGAEWETFCENHLAIRRLATPEEIAKAIVYLCSDDASYSVGTILNVDGGSM